VPQTSNIADALRKLKIVADAGQQAEEKTEKVEQANSRTAELARRHELEGESVIKLDDVKSVKY